MKTAVVLLLSMAGISCAQDKKTENRAPEPAREKKRLESVTWDLKAHKLVWVVQRGTEKDGAFVANAADKYEISPDDAVMAFADQRRGFTQEEASSLHKLLDTLSLYCAESVVWWDQGEGTPLDGKTPSKKPDPKHKEEDGPSPNRQRVGNGDEDPPTLPVLLVAETSK